MSSTGVLSNPSVGVPYIDLFATFVYACQIECVA
jgi:hypothetical protein